jgi:cation diffusion facilitator family transporter
VIALLIAADALWRLAHPIEIDFKPAIVVAIIGLAVNLVSAALLHDGHHHHEHEHHDHGHGRDNNLRAAYLHVLADALTSILAIGALLAGLFLDLVWLDPAIGILGALMIASWSVRLMRESGRVLVDTVPDGALRDAMRHRIEATGARITDLHLWRVGPGHNAAVISLAAPDPRTPDQYRSALSGLDGLSHITIEVHRLKAGGPTLRCPDSPARSVLDASGAAAGDPT